jgi:hypothetical protein
VEVPASSANVSLTCRHAKLEMAFKHFPYCEWKIISRSHSFGWNGCAVIQAVILLQNCLKSISLNTVASLYTVAGML